jgi:hypothetical protein
MSNLDTLHVIYQLMSVTQPTETTIHYLTSLHKDYCKRQGLEPLSADDLLATAELNEAQRQWLKEFSRIWEIVSLNY